MTEPDRLAALLELESKMTPGPWTIGRTDMQSYAVTEDGMIPEHYVYRDPEERVQLLGDDSTDTARAIATFRNVLPELIAVAMALKEALPYIDSRSDAWVPANAKIDALETRLAELGVGDE